MQLSGLIILVLSFIVHLRIIIIWHSQNIFALISYVISFLAFLLVCILSNAFLMVPPFTLFTDNQSLYFIYFQLFQSPYAWLTILFTILTAVIPDLVVEVFENVKESEVLDKFKREKKKIDMSDRTRNIKFLKYLTLPSFNIGHKSSVNNNGNNSNGNGTNSTNGGNNNSSVPSRASSPASQFDMTVLNRLLKFRPPKSNFSIDLKELDENASAKGVVNDEQLTMGLISLHTIDSEPKLTAIKPIEEEDSV